MEAPRVLVVIFVILFLLANPDSQRPTPSQQRQLEQLIVEEHHALNLLNTSLYDDFTPQNNRWINVTGLRQKDGYAWEILPKVQERARAQVKTAVGSPEGTKSVTDAIDEHEAQKSDISIGGVPTSTINATGSSDSWATSLPVYQNVSGIIRGHWARSRVSNGFSFPAVNLSDVAPRVSYNTNEYSRNITGLGGNLRIKLDEKQSEVLKSDTRSVRQIRAEMVIKDDASFGDGWEMTLHGIHYPESGGILLSTTGDKFAGIFALPHFALSEHSFGLAQRLLNKTLMDAVVKQESSMYTSPTFPWSTSPNALGDMLYPTPHCEYIVYLQQHPLKFLGTGKISDDKMIPALQTIEQELQNPVGASIPHVPMMAMSAVIFSPDCGFVLESKGPPDYTPQEGTHLTGSKIESYLRLLRQAIFVLGLILGLEIYLLIRQIKEASTPSTKSRISFYTVAIMAMGDGFVCLCFVLMSMFFDAASLILKATGFLALLSASFFGMKFLMGIWTIQAPERMEREQRNISNQTNPQTGATIPADSTVIITPAGVDTLPLPATARRNANNGATPVTLPPDQDPTNEPTEGADTQVRPLTTLESARREVGALYSRFYFLLCGLLFVSLHATTWPTALRSSYMNVLAFSYLSLWVPQIYRNIMRNCRKALRWEFVIGQSVARSIPLIYFYVIRDNVLFVEVDQHAAFVLIGWVWIQVWTLVGQDVFGPRFFVPDGWAPSAYDYHPVLRDGDEEAGATMPIGFTQATSDSPSSAATSPVEARRNGPRVFDCAICMQNINVPVVSTSGREGEGSSSLGANLFSRRSYMITPCRHIFHSVCLEGWMRYRLQCPICRDNLPPL